MNSLSSVDILEAGFVVGCDLMYLSWERRALHPFLLEEKGFVVSLREVELLPSPIPVDEDSDLCSLDAAFLTPAVL